ncbi:MAG TPA: TonB-dependent receptor [Chitinophagaceae bacterium]
MKQLLALSLLLCSLFSYSQEQRRRDTIDRITRERVMIGITGVVTDGVTGQPLPGANITFTDARIFASAKSEGRYAIRNIPAGHHLVEVSHAGYTTVVEHIDIETDTVKNFTLYPEVVENQGVTVTGVTSATSTRHTPIPVTLVRKNQLLQTPSTNIVDALTRQPGISQIGTGPAISKPVIRGLSYNRVVVVNDGMRQEGQQWGDEHGIEIDELSVSRAEILKGPASIMYGSDALAGVINFITHEPVADGTLKGNIYTNYQTNNNLYGVHGQIGGNYNGFSWNAYGSHKSAKDFRNKYDGRVLNSRFNERSFGGYVGLNKSWGFSHLVVSTFDQNVGLVEGDRDDATGAFLVNPETALERIATKEDLESRDLFTPNQNVRHYRIMSDNNFNIGRSRLKALFGFQNNLRKEYGNPEGLSETELSFDLKTLDYNLQWRLGERNEWETTIGLSGMYQDNQNKGEETIIPEYKLFDVGGFLFSQKRYDDLTITGGLRVDNRTVDSKEQVDAGDIKFNAFTRRFSNVSGSAGLSYYPTQKVTLKFNASRGFRAPTLSELASNGAHEGTNRYEYGEQNLKSERSVQLDGGVDLDFDHISIFLNGFYNRIHDFIFYRRLQSAMGGDSLVELDGELLEAFRYNQSNARLNGVEVVVDLHPHPLDWLHFENTYAITRGRFTEEIDGTRNLPMIPAQRWTSELRTNFNRIGKTLENVYFSVELEKTFDQGRPFTGYNTETDTPGYTLFNAGLGTDVSLATDRTTFSLHFSAQNITDVAYQSHLNRLKYTAENNATGRRGVFNMGRNFSLKLVIPLLFDTRD